MDQEVPGTGRTTGECIKEKVQGEVQPEPLKKVLEKAVKGLQPSALKIGVLGPPSTARRGFSEALQLHAHGNSSMNEPPI